MSDMHVRRVLILPLLFLLAGIPVAATAQEEALSQSQIRNLIRRSADKDLENTKQQRDYTYVRRDEERTLDGKGRVKSTEAKTYEVMVLAGEQVERLIEKNDRPISEKDARKEDEKIEKKILKEQRETARERRKRLEKDEEEIEKSRRFVREIADAYTFRFVETMLLDGRPTYVIDADPISGYKAQLKEARILPKFRFRAWIDKEESQWVKLDIQCVDTVSWGLFLVRLHEGSNIQIEQTRVNDEVWLPRHISVLVDAKIGLLRNLDREWEISFRDYQKFRTDAVIRPLGEVQ